MGIRTKLNPMGGTESKSKYKAYIVIGTNYTDVADLGFTENINPNTCFGSPEDTVDCANIILNGKAYKYSSSTLTRIGNLTNCTSINGTATQGWIISDGKLYYHDSNGTARIGSLSNWTILSGYGSGYKYGIAGGKVYLLSTTTATQISGSYTTATAVSSADGSNAIPVAIADNKLWYIESNSMYGFDYTSIGVEIAASATSGFIKYNSNGGNVAFYIDPNYNAVAFIGKSSSSGSNFYRTTVSNTNNTTQLSGTLRAAASGGYYCYVYALKDSNVYELKSNTVTKKTSSNDVISICGRYQSGYYTTSNGELYRIGSSISKVNIPATTCLKVYGCGTSSSPALAIFEE